MCYCLRLFEVFSPLEAIMISIQRRQSSLRTHSLAGLFLALYMAQHMFFLSLTAKNSKPALSYLPAADQHLQQHQQQISINLDVEFDYLQSIKDTRRKLIFVHIPKTAGTMIESVGGLHATPKVVWGSCLFNHKPKRRGGVCRYPRWRGLPPHPGGYLRRAPARRSCPRCRQSRLPPGASSRWSA